MSAPFVSRWGRLPSHAALAPDEPRGAGGNAPSANNSAAGIFSKPLSDLSTLDIAEPAIRAAPALAPDSARKRVQAWEEKRVRFMEARSKNTGPATPLEQPQYAQLSQEQPAEKAAQKPAEQPARAQAPSPSTPRGLRGNFVHGPRPAPDQKHVPAADKLCGHPPSAYGLYKGDSQTTPRVLESICQQCTVISMSVALRGRKSSHTSASLISSSSTSTEEGTRFQQSFLTEASSRASSSHSNIFHPLPQWGPSRQSG